MTRDNRKYAARLKELRTALVKSKVKLSEELAMRKELYEKYENGEEVIPPKLIGKLCRKYRMNSIWFISGKGKMFQQFLRLEGVPDFGDRNPEVGDLLRCMKVQPQFYNEVIDLFNSYVGNYLI